MKRIAELDRGTRFLFRGVECLKLHLADASLERSVVIYQRRGSVVGTRKNIVYVANVATGSIYDADRNELVTPILSEGVAA